MASITPIFDGFVVVPESLGRGFTVVYMQSALPPSRHGILTYTAFGCVSEDPETGRCVRGYGSFQRDGFLVPTPEPATLLLFGFGLAGIVAKRRTWRHRVTGRPR